MTRRLLAVVALSLSARLSVAEVRQTLSLDRGWKFFRGEAVGAESGRFLDDAWTAVDVPHDWAIAGPYDAQAPSGRGGGYLPSGVSWYRKRFTLPADASGRRVFVELDGVMAGARVWINGYHLGHRPNGYVSFRYELTGQLGFGDDKPNLLAVRTDTSLQPASRWYTGQGIYRHVRLVVTDPVHVDGWGVFVTTPKVAVERALVKVRTRVVNQSEAERSVGVSTTIVDDAGRTVGQATPSARSLAAGGATDFEQEIEVASPRLWGIESPVLYRALTKVIADGTTVDDEATSFGIREARFEAETGFWLNGKNVRLHGVCLHHDGGGVGAAVPLAVWKRRLTRLRALGANAIRTAHNPPAPEFLDLCDRMGFLVMDEPWDAWTYGKPNANYGVHLLFRDYWEADTRDTVRRDRNHPSVVLYSAGNEIHDTPRPDIAKPILGKLLDVFHAEDPTRPVTQALFRPNVSKDYDNGLADMLDVVGQNYRENELVAAHLQKPTRKVVGTETAHSREAWVAFRDHPFIAGQFLWAGIDYLGEADWPQTTFGGGLLDRIGERLPRADQRESWWSRAPVVWMARRVEPPAEQAVDPGYETAQQQQQIRRRVAELFTDWTPRDTSAHTEKVEVYSNAADVELKLNGKSLGSKPKNADDAPRTFEVPFASGRLEAIARNAGRRVASHELKTAGQAAALRLVAEEPRIGLGFDDVAHVTATIVDAVGVVHPLADAKVRFEVSGPGAIIAVDNGDRASHEPYVATERTTYRGRVLAILRANAKGTIRVTATADGLPAAAVTVEAVP